MSRDEPFTTGSGDIFKDFGFSDEEATALNLKASLFHTLQEALKQLPGTQSDIAAHLGVPQPKISDILNGKMSGFSVERLANYLLKLNYDICVSVHPSPCGRRGRVIDRSESLAI